MRTAVRVAVSVLGGTMTVLGIVGLAYASWAVMTPMFAIFDPVPAGVSSIAALLIGAGLLAVRRRVRSASTSGDIPAR